MTTDARLPLTSSLPAQARDLHVPRMLEHASGGLFYSALYHFWLSRSDMLILLGAWIGVYLVVEVLRRRSKATNDLFLRIFGKFLRESEVRGVHSGVPYVISCLLVVALFSKEIAILSMLFLALGDPAASACGKLWGHKGPPLPRGKSLIGSLGAMMTCALITLAVTGDPVKSIAFGIAGAVAEMLPIPVNDNLSMPLVSALLMSLWPGV